jgi:hypothetical protein
MSMIRAAAFGIAAAFALAGCATAPAEPASTANHNKPGFFTQVKDNRLWVLKEGSKELADYQAKGEPARMVTRVGAGPNGMTIRSSDAAVIDAYLAAK